MRTHFCTEDPCPLQDKEVVEIFKHAFKTSYAENNMSSLTEQLREALESYKHCDGDECDYVANQAMDYIAPLLDEHERLERESEAGKNTREEIKERLSKMDTYTELFCADFLAGYRQAYAEMDRTADDIYRSACEGEK